MTLQTFGMILILFAIDAEEMDSLDFTSQIDKTICRSPHVLDFMKRYITHFSNDT